MRGKHYRTIEDVKQAAELSLHTINRLGSANGIQRLPRHWEHDVHNGGDYIEGLWNLEPSRWAIYPVITLVPKLKSQPMYNSSFMENTEWSLWHCGKCIWSQRLSFPVNDLLQMLESAIKITVFVLVTKLDFRRYWKLWSFAATHSWHLRKKLSFICPNSSTQIILFFFAYNTVFLIHRLCVWIVFVYFIF